MVATPTLGTTIKSRNINDKLDMQNFFMAFVLRNFKFKTCSNMLLLLSDDFLKINFFKKFFQDHFVSLFGLILYIPSTIFQLKKGRVFMG